MTQIKTMCVDKVAYEAVLRNSVRVNDLEAENKQLRRLLKECKEILEVLKCGSINDLTASRPRARNLLIKINAVIGESEE